MESNSYNKLLLIWFLQSDVRLVYEEIVEWSREHAFKVTIDKKTQFRFHKVIVLQNV